MRKTILAMVLLGTLVAGPWLAWAESEHSLENLVVQMAETPAQHEALAKYYRAKAEEAREEMERHQHMAHTYGGGKMSKRQAMKKHCEQLSHQYEAMAKEFDALAELHEAEAGQ